MSKTINITMDSYAEALKVQRDSAINDNSLLIAQVKMLEGQVADLEKVVAELTAKTNAATVNKPKAKRKAKNEAEKQQETGEAESDAARH